MAFEIQKTRYLQTIGNNAYIYKIQCLRCFAINSGLLNKQWIDKELEDKETCGIEHECINCKRRFKIEFTKKIKILIKEDFKKWSI